MNCAEWERLLDAYLDRQLAGALRLEFDAHRLGCRRCLQTLSMMEACEHVIAGDKPPVMLSEDFTDQVMAQLGTARRQPRRAIARRWFVGLAATVLPAAAVLLFAAYLPLWRGVPDADRVIVPSDAGVPVVLAGADSASDPRARGIDDVERHERGRALVTEAIAQRLRASLAAGTSLSSETIRMAQYLNIDLPADVARQHFDFATVNPIGGIFFEMLAPPPAPETPDAEPTETAGQTRI